MYRILVVGLVLLAAANLWAQSKTVDVHKGREIFRQYCATCHGASGKGDGPAAAGLNPKPKDLSKMTKSDEEVKKIIADGGAKAGLSPLMPGWRSALSDEDIQAIIAYIRSLKK